MRRRLLLDEMMVTDGEAAGQTGMVLGRFRPQLGDAAHAEVVHRRSSSVMQLGRRVTGHITAGRLRRRRLVVGEVVGERVSGIQRRRVIGRRRCKFDAAIRLGPWLRLVTLFLLVAGLVVAGSRGIRLRPAHAQTVGAAVLLVVVLVALVAARQLVSSFQRLAVHPCKVAISYRVI